MIAPLNLDGHAVMRKDTDQFVHQYVEMEKLLVLKNAMMPMTMRLMDVINAKFKDSTFVHKNHLSARINVTMVFFKIKLDNNAIQMDHKDAHKNVKWIQCIHAQKSTENYRYASQSVVMVM